MSKTTSHVQHIHEIIREDDYDKLLSYISDNNISSLTTYYSNQGISPIFSAIYRNNLKIVKLLFSIGFPKNQLGPRKCTMLSHAMKFDCFETFKYLLSMKVNFGDLDTSDILLIIEKSYYCVNDDTLKRKQKYNRSNGYLIKNFNKYIDVDLKKYKITRTRNLFTLGFTEWLLSKGAILDLTYDLSKYGDYGDKSLSLINSIWDNLTSYHTELASSQLLKNNFVNFYLRNKTHLIIDQTANTIKIPKWNVEEIYHTTELNLPKKIKHQPNVHINGDGYEFEIQTDDEASTSGTSTSGVSTSKSPSIRKYIIDMNGIQRYI